MKNKTSKNIEKSLTGLSIAGGLTASYIAVSDFMQLNDVNIDGLYCITQDPRMLFSAGLGIAAYGLKRLINLYSQISRESLRRD